ncbi:hypothetical protein KM043_014336 [Ampulex compressa]|nr:hypothetical protein KM043_014336 [Ampulex compressa]
MKSMKARARSKRTGTKISRVKYEDKDTTDIVVPDMSNLRPPIDVSVSSLCQVVKLLENASEEVKSMLAYECDVVYECRICRSLFRSVVNFISHKRVFCKGKFDITVGRQAPDSCEAIISKSLLHVGEVEKEPVESCENHRILRSQTSRVESKKDLTAVVDMLQRRQIDSMKGVILDLHQSECPQQVLDTQQIFLENVKSSPAAMYQTVERPGNVDCSIDMMKTQLAELESMAKRTTVILGPDGRYLENGQLEKSDSPVQIYSDEENESMTNFFQMKSLTCAICNARFSTKKTLTVHMKTLHTSHRMCYPCPCCSSTFANTWSVHRHLFKVHRKSNEQVRKLRSHIQEKAFRKESTGAEDIEKQQRNSTLLEREDMLCTDETQEWIDHLECDAELQRCGGCGRRFDRKAALFSHSQHCQRRIAACNEASLKIRKTPKSTLDPSVTPRRDHQDEPHIDSVTIEQSPTVEVIAVSPEKVDEPVETTIRVQAVTSLSKADWDMIESEQLTTEESSSPEVLSNSTSSNNEVQLQKQSHSPSSEISDAPEIIYTKIDDHKKNIGNRRRRQFYKSNANKSASPTEMHTIESHSQDPAKIDTADYTLRMENKIATIANLRKLQCLPCKRKFTSMTNLRRHMAIHVGWNRYRCKLCDFKCFVKCDCVAHCNKQHNAQNNRSVISEMVAEIPECEYTCDRDIVMDIANLEKSPVETVKECRTSSSGESAIVVEKKTVEEDDCVKRMSEDMQEPQEIKNMAEVPCKTTRLDCDPDLRRMVMEVIFGSCEEYESKVKSCELENKNVEENGAITDEVAESKEALLSDGFKPQRPTRNRIKPLNKDFIYDLKEVAFRKEPVLLKSNTFAGRPVKKSLVQSLNAECNMEVQVEQSMNDCLVSYEEHIRDKIKAANEGLKSNFELSQCKS